jgi:hypothetical protein
MLFADVVDGADVGVVEGGSSLGLALKASQSLRVAGDLVGQEFEGDKPAQAGVFGLVDHTHAAATQSFEGAVMGEGLANEGLGFRHWSRY